jgi:hypothetical protein
MCDAGVDSDYSISSGMRSNEQRSCFRFAPLAIPFRLSFRQKVHARLLRKRRINSRPRTGTDPILPPLVLHGHNVLLGGDCDDVLLGGPGLRVLDGGPGANVLIQDARA